MSDFTDQPAKLPNIGEQFPHLEDRITITKINPSLTFSGRQINMSRRSAVARDARNTLVGLCRTWNNSEVTTRHHQLCNRDFCLFFGENYSVKSFLSTSLHYNRKKRERLLLLRKLGTSVPRFDYLREIP